MSITFFSNFQLVGIAFLRRQKETFVRRSRIRARASRLSTVTVHFRSYGAPEWRVGLAADVRQSMDLPRLVVDIR
jgi:hypothetical protein